MAVAEVNEGAVAAREPGGRERADTRFHAHMQIARCPAASGQRFDQIARFEGEKHVACIIAKKGPAISGGPL